MCVSSAHLPAANGDTTQASAFSSCQRRCGRQHSVVVEAVVTRARSVLSAPPCRCLAAACHTTSSVIVVWKSGAGSCVRGWRRRQGGGGGIATNAAASRNSLVRQTPADDAAVAADTGGQALCASRPSRLRRRRATVRRPAWHCRHSGGACSARTACGSPGACRSESRAATAAKTARYRRRGLRQRCCESPTRPALLQDACVSS